ncbi:MAG TPA: penicillin-insensitive murein endopeptidase, partial [Polyangiaceae bacterium]|nr:penicillin-insensitive murein endopeptidase [Polyangiaceae bacterium]
MSWVGVLCALFASVGRAREPIELPARFRTGRLAMLSLSGGYPNEGWQLRGKRLRPSRELHVRNPSRERVYGHPALVLMLGRSARDVAMAAPGSVLLVGDLSSKQGGPVSGHRSHQSGRDADVAFYVTDIHGKPVPSTEYVAFDGDGRAKDGRPLLFDDERNWLLVESWARDRRAGLSHIFVSWPLRERLLKYARSRPKFAPYVLPATALLKQPEKGEAHDDHFHVRITCPK